MRFKPYQIKKMDDTSTEKSEYLCCTECEHVLEYQHTVMGGVLYYCGNTDCGKIKKYTTVFVVLAYSPEQVKEMKKSHVNYN